MADLDGDGIPEVIAQASDLQGGCSATGNCPIWIFRKSATEYKLILDSQGQLTKILDARNEDFRDFLVSVHESTYEQTLLVYRFSGGAYRIRNCYDRATSIEATGATVRSCK